MTSPFSPSPVPGGGGEGDLIERADVGWDADLLCEAVVLMAESQYVGGYTRLQRRLRVGFAKAGHLLDLLDQIGVISPYEGSDAGRTVLIRPDEADYICTRIRTVHARVRPAPRRGRHAAVPDPAGRAVRRRPDARRRDLVAAGAGRPVRPAAAGRLRRRREPVRLGAGGGVSRTVSTQAELDQAIVEEIETVYIDAAEGVWLYVVASDSSHVVARGSSHVVARGSSHVVASDSSHVEAWDSSHVEAGSHVAVHLHSQRVELTGGVVIDMTAIDRTDPQIWCDLHGVKVTDGTATVYKAVDPEFVAGRSYIQTSYAPGTTPAAADWRDDHECGGGLHFGPTPLHALEYHQGDVNTARFLAVGVALDDLRPLDGGTAKCKAPRVVIPCFEVDRYGQPLAAKREAS